MARSRSILRLARRPAWMLLAAAGAAWSAAPSSPSAAQADTARPRAGLDEPRAFDLPPGPLSAALRLSLIRI